MTSPLPPDPKKMVPPAAAREMFIKRSRPTLDANSPSSFAELLPRLARTLEDAVTDGHAASVRRLNPQARDRRGPAQAARMVRGVQGEAGVEKPNPLSPEELEVVLQRLPGWTLEDTRIAKEFQFQDFVESLSFINRLVPYFEQKDHHPDVHIYYNRVRFELSRYDVGGKITDRDVEVAKLIEHEHARVS